MRLTLGFSPCPNDTFIFDALVNGRVGRPGLALEPVLEDVETLNRWALAGKLDVTKVSYGVVPAVAERYALLPAGGALGVGVGPLLVARPGLGAFDPATMRVAIPGEHTTAHVLFSLAYPAARARRFVVFSEVEDAVLRGEVEAGVLIHENRFTYEARGLVKVLDLGAHWERATGAPVPLGAIAARRSLGAALHAEVNALIRASLLDARARWPEVSGYVRRHAQAMDPDVMRRHVELYVNEHSLDVGERGRAAVARFVEVAARATGVAVPEVAALFG
jgi:1,4-dihydroxy-6-naphthoate synthase